ncbi:hypothetical protein ACFYO5_35985 [Streptomyces sp. NPDC006259]|uniref:hypothetical protein n=1 Tax=Streptomyces sp. NPDC006259 TaxID=3364740 RepID=UPI0036CB60A2
MAQPMRSAKKFEAGDAWLADCSARPDLVREAWDLEGLAPIASGKAWLAAEVHLTTGMQAHSRIRPDMRGPFLVDPGAHLAWFLIALCRPPRNSRTQRHFACAPPACSCRARPPAGKPAVDSG